MYLKTDEFGVAKAAFNIPVIGGIEITEEKWEEIKEECKEDKWFVNNGQLTIEPTEAYTKKIRLEEIEKEMEESEIVYTQGLEELIEIQGRFYKTRWIVDGTYANLITGMLAGIITFPQDIWDATKKKENMVSMSKEQFEQLVGILAQRQSQLFNARKIKQDELITEREQLLN